MFNNSGHGEKIHPFIYPRQRQLNLPSYKSRNLQRWGSLSLSLLTDQKSLPCHFHSESSYLTEQGLYVGLRFSLGACIFSPVPQWLFPVTLAKQSASRYAFSSTIWTQRDGVEWLWACDIYRNPRLVLPCFPFWARMQMEFGAAQAVPPTHAVMDNFQLDTH